MMIGSTLAVVPQLTVMAAHLPLPAWLIGVIAFLILASMMGVVLSMGKGRPHS